MSLFEQSPDPGISAAMVTSPQGLVLLEILSCMWPSRVPTNSSGYSSEDLSGIVETSDHLTVGITTLLSDLLQNEIIQMRFKGLISLLSEASVLYPKLYWRSIEGAMPPHHRQDKDPNKPVLPASTAQHPLKSSKTADFPTATQIALAECGASLAAALLDYDATITIETRDGSWHRISARDWIDYGKMGQILEPLAQPGALVAAINLPLYRIQA